ncbi:MAG: cyclic nucleotide-binding domain-containing protein [Oligoflexia bacterium]|nr:cyclic nucleotide-binding domain-containing protein [Oligoflexia bacterium]
MVSVKHLKKGDPLMKEGETSNSMYWVQSGTLRLFKKKGTGFIELGVVHSGEVVGEMSFLDNQPRSASVEALQPCDIIEIPRGKFDEFINAQPSWMKSLVHTLVKRLRTTNNRVRELENASTVYAKDESGKTTKVHEFLSTNEIMRLCSGLILGFSRHSEKTAEGSFKIKSGWFQFYASQVNGVQLAKVQVFTDVMHEAKIIRIEKTPDMVNLFAINLDFLEKFMFFCHDENSKTDDKRLPITEKGVAILNAIDEFSDHKSLAAGTETFSVNLSDVYQKAVATWNKKIPFEWNAYEELVKSGLSQEVRVTGEERSAVIQTEKFKKLQPVLSLRQKIRDLNAQKRDT